MNSTKDNLKGLAQGIISSNSLNEYIIEFHPIEDKDLNKSYEVYYTKTNNSRYVFKKSKSGYEPRIYETFFISTDIPVPKYYGKATDLESNVWFLLEYIDGNSFLNETLKNYCNAATQLAIIHSQFINILGKEEKYKFLRNKNEVTISKIDKIIKNNIKHQLNWSPDILNGLKYITTRLSKAPTTIIQDDLLPINIISKNNEARFIDWEYASIGCYAHDIGRLLSDFKNENGVKWVNSEWEQSILSSYFTSLCRTGVLELSMDEFLLDYQYCKILNYAGIVFAHILNNWDLTNWYKLNFEAMINGLKGLGVLDN